MPGRQRTSYAHSHEGTGWDVYSGAFIGNGMRVTGYNSCSDVVGTGVDCNPFGVEHWHYEGCRLNRDGNGWGSGKFFQNYIPDAFNYDGNWPHGDIPGLQSSLAIAAKAAARTNPSRPYVDVGVNVAELGDVTQLLRNAGRNFFGSAGGGYLKYQFGIAPLVGDLVKLTQFRKVMDDRIAEVKRLQGPKGLRRTVNADAGSGSGSKTVYMQTYLASLDTPDATWHYEANELVRAHVRWNAAGVLPDVERSAEVESLVRRAVLGLAVDGATLWEAIPWSWLIDYGTTVGDYFKAHRNIIPAYLNGVWVMRHRRTVWTTEGRQFAYGEGHMAPGTFIRETKLRSYSMPVLPIAHFPFLNGNQMGILGALAVSRL